MKISKMKGFKLFKELEDGTIHLIRIVDMKQYKDGADPIDVTIVDQGNGEKKKIRVDELKGYTPLEPDGLCIFSTVNVKDTNTGKVSKDVIITGSKILNVKFGDNIPYCVCRQSVTDIFYNLLCSDEEHTIAGLSVNRDNIPTNFNYMQLLGCDEILYVEYINFYRTDTLQDILGFVKVSKFDAVLTSLYEEHVKYVKNPSLNFKEEDKGWCKTLKRLLTENNFQNDLDEMLGITAIDFKVTDYIEEKTLPTTEEKYLSVTKDLQYWLSSIFKINMKDIYILEYNHDINLADFNDTRYIILRDSENKVYLVVYTLAGEYKEAELEAKDKELDFSSKFRINFYNKYNSLNKSKN